MVATELIDGGIKFEIYLVQSADEINGQIIALVMPDQPVFESIRQSQPEKSSLAAAWAVIKPVLV